MNFATRLILLLMLLAILYSLTGCAAKLPNTLVCVEMSISRGECVRTVSGEKVTIDEEHPFEGKTWWAMRPTNLVIPMASWIEMKKFIIKMCKQNQGMCDSEVSDWDRSIQTIDFFQTEKLP